MQVASAAFKQMVEGNSLLVGQDVGITLPIVRTNECPTPSFENPLTNGGLGNWYHGSSLGDATIDVSTTRAWIGTHSLHVVFGTGTSLWGVNIPTAKLGTNNYVAMCMVYLGTAGPPVKITGSGGNTVSTRGSWQLMYSYVGGGPTQFWMFNSGAATAGAGVECWIDAVLFEKVPSGSSGVPSNTYFDGTFPNAAWLGLPDLSASTLNVSPYPDYAASVESATIDRQLTTSLPDGTTLITGYPTAQATIVLAGQVDPTNEDKTVAWLFNPYQTDSPMYRHDLIQSPVVCQEGLYPGTGSTPELITNFTGYVDDFSVDTIGGQVTLTCLDNRTKLRSSATAPAFAATMDVASGTSPVLSTQSPGLTSLWIIDTLLRSNGYLSSPGPRSGAYLLFYASYAGSAYPSVYLKSGYPVLASNSGLYNDESTTTPMQFVNGGFNKQVCRDSSLQCSLDQWSPNYPNWPTDINVQVGGGYFHEFWLNTATPPLGNLIGGVLSGTYQPLLIKLSITDLNYTTSWITQIQMTPVPFVGANAWSFTTAGGVARAITTSGTWQQVSIQVSYTAGPNVVTKLWLDGVLINTWTDALTVSPAAPPPGTGPGPDTITINSPYPLEAFQTTNELNGIPSTGFTPTAILDASLNFLTAISDIAGLDPWQVIQQLAEAELAIAGFDELGIFRFTNRLSLASTPTRTITSLTSLQTYQVETGLSLVTNHVTANINTIVRSGWEVVWSGVGTNVTSGGLYFIPPNSTDTILAALTIPSIVCTLTGVIPIAGVSATHVKSGYVADSTIAGTGGGISNLSMAVQQLSPSLVKITITNPNPFNVYFVALTGYPNPGSSYGVTLAGEALVSGTAASNGGIISTSTVADSQWPPIEEGGADPRKYAIKALPDNPWRQDAASVQALTDHVLSDLYRPRPIIRNLSIVADPRLQLGDRVTIVDSETNQLSDDMFIIGIRTTSGNGAWDQSITCRAVANAGDWVMGVVGRSELGTSTYV